MSLFFGDNEKKTPKSAPNVQYYMDMYKNDPAAQQDHDTFREGVKTALTAGDKFAAPETANDVIALGRRSRDGLIKVDQVGQVQQPTADYFIDLYKSTPDARENKDDFRTGMSEFYKQWEANPTGTVVPTSAKSVYGAGRAIRDEETRYDIIGGAITLARSLAMVPKQTAASVLTALQGPEGASVTDRDWGDRYVQSAKEDANRFVQETAEAYKNHRIFPGIKITDVADLAANAGFSAASMGAGAVTGLATGLATGAAASLVTTPIGGAVVGKAAGMAAGTVASGVAAYNMAGYQFMQEFLEARNEEIRAKTGADMTSEQEGEFKDQALWLAAQNGLWEAIPEAIGNRLGVGILFGKLTSVFGEGAARRIVSKFAAGLTEELATETTTQMGQHNVGVDAGTTPGPKREFGSAADWYQSLKEVAPQTILLTAFMGGAGGIGKTVYDKIQGKKTAINDQNMSQSIQAAVAEDAMDLLSEDVFQTIRNQTTQILTRNPKDIGLQKAAQAIEDTHVVRTVKARLNDPADPFGLEDAREIVKDAPHLRSKVDDIIINHLAQQFESAKPGEPTPEEEVPSAPVQPTAPVEPTATAPPAISAPVAETPAEAPQEVPQPVQAPTEATAPTAPEVLAQPAMSPYRAEQQKRKALIDIAKKHGIDDEANQRDIHNEILDLGTIEAVNSFYGSDVAEDEYAREIAPILLGVEPTQANAPVSEAPVPSAAPVLEAPATMPKQEAVVPIEPAEEGPTPPAVQETELPPEKKEARTDWLLRSKFDRMTSEEMSWAKGVLAKPAYELTPEEKNYIRNVIQKPSDQMYRHELQYLLLKSEVSGIPGRRAYYESEKKPVQASLDINNFKGINDTLGHDTGDQVIKAVATILQETIGEEAYHISGDEFLAQGDTVEEVRAALAKANAALDNYELDITLPDGEKWQLKGITLSAGIGEHEDVQEAFKLAEADLHADKQRQIKEGRRAEGRGATPVGLRRVEEAPAGDQVRVPENDGSGNSGEGPGETKPEVEAEPESTPPPKTDQERVPLFKAALDKVARGDYYVSIYKIRRQLNWPRDMFDDFMDHLMVEGHVLANPGNPSKLTEDQIEDCYQDEFGDLYLTVNWRGGEVKPAKTAPAHVFKDGSTYGLEPWDRPLTPFEIKLQSGDILTSATGRQLLPFPVLLPNPQEKSQTTSVNRTRINKWLINEGIEEAKHRHEQHGVNGRIFESLAEKPKTLTVGDADTLNFYIFGPEGLSDANRVQTEEAPAPAPKPAKPKPERKPVAKGSTEIITTNDKGVQVFDPIPLADVFYTNLGIGVFLKDKNAIKKFLSDYTGRPSSEISSMPYKAVEEAYEYAITCLARDIIEYGGTVEEIYDKLKGVYNKQPGMNTRTGMSMSNQAYSTPVHLGYLMQVMAGANRDSANVYEPTAGTGMLLTAVPRAKNVTANEKEDLRFSFLKDAGYHALQGNGATLIRDVSPDLANTQDAVLANPPFGAMLPAVEVDGYKLTKLEHAIVADALKAMKNDGKAAFIIGGHNFRDGRMIGPQRVFLNWLFHHYNVTANYDIPGDEYARQGTSYPVRLIVVEGRKANPEGFAPTKPEGYGSVTSVDDLVSIAKEMSNGERSKGLGSLDTQGNEGIHQHPANGGGDEASGVVRGKDKGAIPAPIRPENDQADNGEPGKGRGSGRDTGQHDEGLVSPGTQSKTGTDTGADATRGQLDGSKQSDTGLPEGEDQLGRSKDTLRIQGDGPAGRSTDQSGDVQGGTSGRIVHGHSGGNDTNVPGIEQAIAEMSDDDISDLFDDVLADQRKEGRESTPATNTLTAESIKTKPVASETAQGKNEGLTHLADAGKSLIKSIDAALEGASALFGGSTRLNSGLVFDAETYKKAKPFFVNAWELAKEAGWHIKQFAKYLVDKFGVESVPYAKQFFKDVRDGNLEMTEDAPKPEAPLQELSSHQAPYVPKSKGAVIDETLVPLKMQQAISGALDTLESEVGGIDKYVAGKLQFDEKQLFEVLSADQIDAVALGIWNIEKGMGMIIGDQTGVGKGRVAAAVYHYAKLQGLKPIFFTEKRNLFTDFYRDITNIRSKNFRPLILASKKEAAMLDTDGNVAIPCPKPGEKKAVIKALRSSGLAAIAPYDGIVTTYSQINTPGAMQAALAEVTPHNIVLMDEAHNASGESNTGRYMMARLQEVHGVVYLSATFAKRPETMGIYFRTAMSQANVTVEQLITAIARGGTPLQEIMSNALAGLGQYIRREKSFRGIDVGSYTDVQNRERDEKRMDASGGVLRAIVDLDNDIKDFVDGIQDAIKDGETPTLGGIHVPGGIVVGTDTVAASVTRTNFASTVHNAIRQLMLSMKADMAVDQAIKELEAGRKPMIALSNTMGSFIKDLVDNGLLRVGEYYDLSLNESLMKHLRRVLTFNVTPPTGGDAIRGIMDVSELPPDLQKKYKAIEKAINVNAAELPGSPIDYIIGKLIKAGYTVGEVTGRKYVTDFSDPDFPILRTRSDEEINDKNVVINGFNNGAVDVIIVNASGASGMSIHTDPNFKDLRPRTYIGIQGELNVDTEVQKMGRINRKGQVNLPKFVSMYLDLPSENRPAAILQRKLASLSANTSANSDSPLAQREFPDMMNKYGDLIVGQWAQQHADLVHTLNLNPERDLTMEYLSGKMAIQPVQVQRDFYDEVELEYKLHIEDLKEQGLYDLDVRDLDYQATVESRDILTKGKNEKNPFGESTWLEKINCKSIKKPLRADAIQDRIDAHLKGKATDDAFADMIKTAASDLEKYVADQRSSLDVEGLTVEQADAAQERVETNIRKAMTTFVEIQADLEPFRVGRNYEILMGDYAQMDAVLMAIRNDRGAGNPARHSRFRLVFAVNNGMQTYTMPLSRIMTPGTEINETGREIPVDWDENLPGEFRETHWVFTGNLVQGFADAPYGATIVRFTMADGIIREGILMPQNWRPSERAGGDNVRLTADQVVEVLRDSKPVSGGGVNIFRSGDIYKVATPKSRASGGKFFQDEELQRLTVHGDFASVGNEMRADVRPNNLSALVKRVHELGATFSVPRSIYNELFVNNEVDATVAKHADQIQTAYSNLTGNKSNERVRLAELRKATSDLTTNEFNAAIQSLQENEQATLMQLDDPADITPEDRRAALYIAGQPRHIVYMDVKLAQDNKAQYSTKLPPARSFTLKDIQETFKGQHVGLNPDGSFWVQTRSGYGLTIKSVKQITVNQMSFKVAYGRMHDGETVAGKYQDGKIEIHRIHGGKWTLAHETTHWLEESGLLSSLDVSILRNHIKKLVERGEFVPENAEMPGGAEDRANFIADRLNDELTGAVAKIVARVKEFIDKLVNLVTRTPGGITRDINSGKIFGGKGKSVNASSEHYATLTQAIGSADTSIPQVAALFKKELFKPGKLNVDIGGGRFDLGTKWLKENRGTENLVFDPYNRSEAYNHEVFQRLQSGEKGDTVSVNNVLNVVAEQDSRENIVLQAAKAVKADGTAYFQIYEGDRKGHGRKTTKGWQNQKISRAYEPEIQKYFGKTRRDGNVIIATNPQVNGQKAIWDMGPEGAGREQYSLARKPIPTPKTDALLANLPSDVQDRLQLSAGLGQATFAQKAKDVADRIWKNFTRHHVTLDSKRYGDVTDLIRQLEEIPQIATRKATKALVDITKVLQSKDHMKLFTYSLIMDDMIKDMESGGILEGTTELPFGFTEVQARRFHAQIQAEVAKSPEVQDALIQRKQSMVRLQGRLVKAKLLPADTLKDSRYFHHQVILHRAVKEMGADYQSKPGLSTQDARMHKKGWQIARKGSIEDYNTDYFESEFEVMAQAEAQLKTAAILARIQDKHDLHGDLVEKAKTQNVDNLWKTLRAQGLIQKDKNGNDIDPLLPWKMKTAMANGKLGEMANKGQLVFDPQYASLVQDLADSYRNYIANKKAHPHDSSMWGRVGVNDAQWFPFLSHLIQNQYPGAMWAGTVYRAMWDKDAYIRSILGKDFKTWRDLVPEGHTAWQPKPDGVWFQVNTLPDHIIEKMRQTGAPLPAKIGKAWARGTAQEWVLPDDVASTMDNVRNPVDDHMLSKASSAIISGWKQWTLLNPFRVLRYNMNNLSGDVDIVLAYDPKILKLAWQAGKDLWKYGKGAKLSPAVLNELDYAQDKAVTSSGWALQEVTDVTGVLSHNQYMSVLTGQNPSLIQRFWQSTQNFTQWRENVLRLAAFRHFKNQIADGRTPGLDLFGASNRDELASVAINLTGDEAAAKMARELVGDYGNLTEAGQWLRRHLIPFYSWMEINAPRYVRLMRNMPNEGKGATAMSGAMAWKATKLGMKMFALYGAVMLWNMIFFPDEWDELGEAKRRQLHLIFGRHSDGTIRSIRFQGALSDALSWFGMEDLPSDIEDVTSGKTPVLDKVGESLSAPFIKLWQGARPLEKSLVEVVMGQSTYPDPTFPRPIRDKWEHIARTFSLDAPYSWLAGKPKQGGGIAGQLIHDVLSLGSYNSDPGESAYYDIKKWQRDYLDRHGIEKPSISPTDKGNALYYYKQALRYGDLKAAKKYLEKYIELGGKRKGIKLSIELSHPLGGLPKKQKAGFMKSLTPKQKETYDRALTWYRETYRGWQRGK
jgi:diguanylate cyclase (GGDEF)-like protein